jgi:exodeoxyribonuclease V alpha subunit
MTILTKCHRQAGLLEKYCSAILDGRLEKTPKKEENGSASWQNLSNFPEQSDCLSFIIKAITEIITNYPSFNIIEDLQILAPQRKGVVGVNALNVEGQKLIQKIKYSVDVEPTPEGKRPKLYQFDKIIQTKNDYKLDIMNGAIGQIQEILADGNLIVSFVGYQDAVTIPRDKIKNVDLAYCLTVHKSQGSEFKFVIAVIHKASSYMNNRSIVYTAATRASKKLILCGDSWGMRNAMEKVEVDRRKTWLSILLREVAANV